MQRINAKDFKAGIIAAYNNLEKNKVLVNALNVFPVPDGDTGTNMSLTMKSVAQKLQSTPDTMKEVAKALGTGSLMGARGNSGVILSQLCRGITQSVEDLEDIGTKELALALDKSRETAYKAVLKPTEGTILTVARLMAEFALENYNNYTVASDFLIDIVKEGNRVLDQTPDMLPVLKQAGVVDAGGKGLMVLLEGFLAFITGQEVIIYDQTQTAILDSNDFEDLHEFDSVEDIEFGYCTEFFINHNGSQDLDEWRELVTAYGDSIVVVGDENLIKTHIHTNNPGAVMELGLQRGPLSGIKIDNMRMQYAEVQDAKQAKAKVESKEYGFVTISLGEGFDAVFKDLSVDQIISGGQTMNPSTEDIVEAINKINAKTVYVLPNNKNIILAAKQAKEIIEDKQVVVIETRSIPEAFTALLSFDETQDWQTNSQYMIDALADVKTIELTYAVRDTSVGDLIINQGDVIGINEKDIVTKGNDVNQTMQDLVKKSINDDIGLITIYYGKDISQEQAEFLQDILADEYPDFEVDLIYGGQPLYYYIASLE